MKTTNTVDTFLALYHTQPDISADHLRRQYHDVYGEIFQTYFQNYVKGAPADRIAAAMPRYPRDLQRIQQVATAVPALMNTVRERAVTLFGFESTAELIMLVGVYASNAWLDRQNRIGVSVERAPADEDGLTVLLAHELCHWYHFAFLKQAGYDWKRPITAAFWAYLEGVATYYSRLLCPASPDENIYCYGDLVEDASRWVSFCRSREADIAAAFAPVLGETNGEVTTEWFRLSGGERFGLNRLGYYLGTRFVEHMAETHTMQKVLTLVHHQPVEPLMAAWLEELQED